MKQSIRQTAKTLAAKMAFRSGLVDRMRRKDGLLVLMLHKVNNEDDVLQLTLRPDLFESVLQEITGSRAFSSMNDIDRSTSVVPNAGGLHFCCTFDDGYLDNFEEAFPIITKYGIPATIYLSTDHIDGVGRFWFEELSSTIMATPKDNIVVKSVSDEKLSVSTEEEKSTVIRFLNQELKALTQEARHKALRDIVEQLGDDKPVETSAMLSWDHVKAMSNAGIQFGSHTVSHPILSCESAIQVEREVQQSKSTIEKKVGSEVHSFAYPNGTESDFNDDVVDSVVQAGYANACTTVPGVNFNETDRYRLRRVALHNHMCTDSSGDFDREMFWTKILSIF